VASEDPWTSLAVAIGSSQLIRSELPRTWLRWLRVLSRSGGDLRLWELQATDGDRFGKLACFPRGKT
jgi:hypothetical protein